MKPWLVYSLVRLGLFAAVFALLYGVLNFEPWLAAVIAAIVGLCLAYLFFRPQRDRAISSIIAKPETRGDELAEDR